MKNKKIILLAILFVSLLAVSAVNAADNATSDVVSVEEITVDVVEVTTGEVVSVENDNQVSANDSDWGTFDDLSNEINAIGDNVVLNLTKNYEYVSGYAEGITISKPITINGQGHSIDGKNLSRIFNIKSNNVILKNINFINGFTSNEGGAIYWQGNNGEINNCNFDNNIANKGGAILLTQSNNFNVFCSNFTNNLASIGGGAIYSTESNFNIDYSTFNNNSAIYTFYGGVDNNINITIFVSSEDGSYSNGFPMDTIVAVVKSGNEYKQSFTSAFSDSVSNPKNDNNIFHTINCHFGGPQYYSNQSYYFTFAALNTTYGVETLQGYYNGGNSIYGDKSTGNINNTIFITPNKSEWSMYYDKNVSLNRNNVFKFNGLSFLKTDTNLEFNNTEFDFNNAFPLSATLKDEYGNFISNQIIAIKLSNPNEQYPRWFTGVTDEKGYISVIYDNYFSGDDLNYLSPGVWNAEVTFREDDNYYGCNQIGTLTIYKKKTSIAMENIFTSINNQVPIVANVMGLNNITIWGNYYDLINYAENLTVDFYVDGNFIDSVSIFNNSANFFENKNSGSYLSSVFNGTAISNYIANASGFHEIHVIFNGNKYFEGSECYATLFVDEVIMDLTAKDTIRNSNTKFVAYVSNLLNETINEGSVIFYDNGYLRGRVSVVNNTAIMNYVPTTTGNHTLRAVYTGNSKFLDVEQTATYIVEKVGTKLVVENNTGIVYDDAKILVKVIADNNETIYSGAVHFYFNDNYMGYAPVYEGLAIIPIEYFFTGFFQYSTNDDVIVDSVSLWEQFNEDPMSQGGEYMMNIKPQVMKYTIGNNIINAIYSNSNDFADSSIISNFTVNKAKSNILIESCCHDWDCMITVYPIVSDYVYLNGSSIDEGTVKIYIDGKYVEDSSIKNGHATFNHMFSKAGKHSIYVEFCESNYFLKSHNTTEISLNWTNIEITHENINGIVMSNLTFSINVTNDYSIVYEGIVSLYYDNDYIDNFTVVNGTAELSFIPQTIGNHIIKLKYGGSENFHTGEDEFNIEINKIPASIILENVTGTFGFESIFIANVKSLDYIINDGVVLFYINDEYLGSVPVVDGSASFVYTPFIVGDYAVKAVFMDSENFLDDESSTGFTVKSADSEVIIDDLNGTVGHELTITVNVISPNNLTINEGYVIFLDGETNIGEANVVDGVATLTYTPSVVGEHTITAIFNSDNYLSSNSTAKLLVDNATVEVLVNTGTVGYNSTFVANVKGLYSTINEGNVAFYINEEYLGQVPVVDGSASLVYTPLTAGEYTVKAVFSDTDKFLDDENITSFNVKSADSEIIINDLNGTVGHELVIAVNVVSSNNLTINEGYVIFFDGSTQIGEANVIDGVATLTYTPATAGEHPITAMFYSANYGDSINSALLTVNKADIDLSIDYINDVYFTNPSNFAININSNSKPVNEGKIKYYVNNELVGIVDVYEGTANFDYVTDATGSFTLTAAYEETDNYFAKNASTTFTVNKMPTTLSGESVIFDEESYKTFTTELKDDNSNGVGGQPVKIEVIKYSGESATFNGISDANGITVYDVGRLAGGMWYVTGVYAGNNNYISSRFVDKFLVVRMNTTTEIEEIDNPKVNHNYKLKANIHDENGKLVKEGIVQFYLDGVDIGSIDLSNNQGHQSSSGDDVLGVANSMFEYVLGADNDVSDLYINYVPTKAGKHTLTAVYEGTTIYKASNSTTIFEVTEESTGDNTENNTSGGNASDINNTAGPEIVIPPLDQPSDDGSVTISFPEDATGMVTLTINGKEYYFAVVKGAANVIIPDLGEGDYPYTITYSGDSKYSSFTNNGTLNKAAPVVDPVITTSNVKVTYATGKYYTIKVYGTDGKLADGAKVVIKVKGKTFKTLTTTNGVAKFKVTNVPGTYKMTITSLGKSVTKTLTVKHLVTLKSVTVKKSAKKLTLQATLGKVNGKYLKNKKITFKFNGKKYAAKTDKKGVAKVTIKSTVLKKLKVGKKVTYQATYSKDTVKKTVKVKK